MLIEFITANREALIARARVKVAKRLAPAPTEQEMESGVPLFLDQFVVALRRTLPASDETMDLSAAKHGALLLDRGYTIAQVVHDYGDVCQAITELAKEAGAPILTDEFHSLNLCLDNAIAEAVTEYARVRDQSMAAGETERLGVFAHELRNKIAAAQLAFQAIRSGRASAAGSVSAVLMRSLHGMTALINRALVEVRLDSGTAQRQRVHVRALLEEAAVEGTLEASSRGVSLSVAPMGDIDIDADLQILAGAVANLLQNALKFTPGGGHVSLRATVVGGRVQIAIEDECGGLPEGKAEEIFGAFRRHGDDRSGLGLGLFISRNGAEACGGSLRVRDLPGRGCVFTIDLPVMPPAP